MSTKSSDPLQYLVSAVSGDVKINTPVLEGGHFTKDNTGSAAYNKGKSAVVFSFQRNKHIKAIKIWPYSVSEYMRNRYLRIEHFLHNTDLDCFINCSYIQDAITLKGTPHDILVMDPVGCQNIKEYIIANLYQPEKLNALAAKLLHLHLMLNQAGIAHGHLHLGNIYADAKGELKLIDYDSLYVKGTTEEEALGQVYSSYCHPANSTTAMINQQADYFAVLIIYTGIKAIARDPVLWGRYKVGFQEDFLFTAADFSDLKNASAYKYLRKNHSPQMDKLLDILLIYCQEKNPDSLKPFYTYLSKDLSPFIQPLSETEINPEQIKSSVLVTAANEIGNHTHITIPAATAPVPNKVIDTGIEPTTPASQGSVANKKSGNLSVTKASQASVPEIGNNVTSMEIPAKQPPVLTVVHRRTGTRKAYDDGSLKKQRTKFLVAFGVVCIVIIAASYLLGEFADDANKYDFKTDAETTSQPAKPAEKQPVAASAEKDKTPVIKKFVDTAVRKAPDTLPAENPAELPVMEIQNSIPVIAKENVADSIAVAPINKKVVKNKSSAVDTALAESSVIAADEKDTAKEIVNTTAQKANNIKKQPEPSFKIGAPPKQ